jgi:hypothetical protein
MNVKLTKGLLTREEVLKQSPAYVAFVEQYTFDSAIVDPFMWDYENVNHQGFFTCQLKREQAMITFFDDRYVSVKVSSVKNPMHDADGPIVRVTNGEYSWRVDGDKYGVCI